MSTNYPPNLPPPSQTPSSSSSSLLPSASAATLSRSPSPPLPPPTTKFPWHLLPHDLRLSILHQLPLTQLLHAPIQSVFISDAPALADARIRRLQPLWKAWLDSPLAVRNPPNYRTRAARKSCNPAEFVTLERLVLGSSRFTGCLTSAIAEFSSLKVLHLDQNDLDDLPLQLAKCTSLKLLDCAANSFCRIPLVVTRMPHLKYIIFSHNPRLTTLPPQLSALHALVAASFYMCALERLPVELVKKITDTPEFTLNVAANNFPRLYLVQLCDQWPDFKRRLTHVMVE